MISNQILQTTIDGLKNIARIDLSILDTEGKVLATTVPGAENYESTVLAFVESPADSQVIQGHLFSRCMMSSSWNMCCWPTGTMTMSTW